MNALLYGDKWEASVPIIQILALAGIVQSVSFFKGHILMAMGKPSWRLWQSLLSVTLNIIGFMVAFKWGLAAVAAAYVIRRYLVFPIGQWAISLLIHFSWSTYLKQFVTPMVSAATMAAAMVVLRKGMARWLNNSTFLTIVVCSLLGAVVYIALVKLLSPQLFQMLLVLFRRFIEKIKPTAKQF